MENNKNKKSVKFQGDMLNFCDFIQVFVFTTNHHLNFPHYNSGILPNSPYKPIKFVDLLTPKTFLRNFV